MGRIVLKIGIVLVLVNSIMAVNAAKLRRNKKVINGKTTDPHEFPYQVALLLSSGVPHCGGSIIDKHFILTAAHCKTKYYRAMQILAGGHSYKNYDKKRAQIREIGEFVIPITYRDDSWDDDIGLIYVEEGFDFNKYVQPITLSTDVKKEPKGKIVVSGWGLTEGGNPGSKPEFLQKATLNIMSNKTCHDLWGSYYPTNVFCASVAGKKIDICDGDSGGPAVQGAGKDLAQIGVVNFSADYCADEKEPGTFLWVARYKKWIEDTKQAILASKSKKRSKKTMNVIPEISEESASDSVEISDSNEKLLNQKNDDFFDSVEEPLNLSIDVFPDSEEESMNLRREDFPNSDEDLINLSKEDVPDSTEESLSLSNEVFSDSDEESMNLKRDNSFESDEDLMNLSEEVVPDSNEESLNLSIEVFPDSDEESMNLRSEEFSESDEEFSDSNEEFSDSDDEFSDSSEEFFKNLKELVNLSMEVVSDSDEEFSDSDEELVNFSIEGVSDSDEDYVFDLYEEPVNFKRVDLSDKRISTIFKKFLNVNSRIK